MLELKTECEPFSGAEFRIALPVTSFLSTSILLSCCSSGAISACIFDPSSPWLFFCVSRYWASSSASSSNEPSIRSVFIAPGISSTFDVNYSRIVDDPFATESIHTQIIAYNLGKAYRYKDLLAGILVPLLLSIFRVF